MYGGGYVGNAADAVRIRRQQKQREEERKQLEDAKKAQKERADHAGMRQFGTGTMEVLDNVFKTETIGLVTRQEFIQKRNTLQERLEEEQRQARLAAEDALLKEKERKRREKEKNSAKAKLSFADEEDGVEEEEEQGRQSTSAAQNLSGSGPGSGADQEDKCELDAPSSKKLKFSTLGKDPSVRTEFLPDMDRAREEEELRSQLKKEYQARVAACKAEPLEVTYSYWDGQGHRRKIVAKKGFTVGAFLKEVKDQLATDFRELRHVSVDNLLFIKEDIILPHHVSFYDLIVNKARGKSGPLFNFGVVEDVRAVQDATVEKRDSHAAKVVERHWYDKNKHIFPANRWEVYDPEKVYDKYTIATTVK